MRQLVQLQEHADKFRSLGAELIFVFREEGEGVRGLKKIKAKYNTTFKLAVDKNAKSSGDYSPKRMTFDNFVIDSSGTVRGIVDGTLKDRATAEQLISHLKDIQSE